VNTSNPALNAQVFRAVGQADTRSHVMTLDGTIFKTGLLVLILLLTADFSWTQTSALYSGVEGGTANWPLYIIGGSVGGLVFALITIFAPRASPITAPLYAACEGLLLGAISSVFDMRYQGIVLQALGLTVGTLLVMLLTYWTRLLQATDRFRIGVVSATGAICLVYVATMILSLFGIRVPYIHEGGIIGIGFSLFVVVIAALNLILDFDFIEQGVRYGAPKYMEWYGGFGLLVTLIWLYLEILRLLAKLRQRD
jgi:uncharacterized YccA/Bax inhibitor family protein